MKEFLKALWLTKKAQVIVACVAAVTVVGGGTVATIALLNNNSQTEVAAVDENGTPVIIDDQTDATVPGQTVVDNGDASSDENAENIADTEDLGEVITEEMGDKISQTGKPKPSGTTQETPTGTQVNNSGNNAPQATPLVEKKYYTIKFVTNSDSSLSEKKYEANTALSNLPSASKKNAIFRGWYYDSSLKTPVVSTDVLTQDLTLYAKYSDINELEYTESSQAIIRNNVANDFTISIVSRSGKDLASVASQVKVENLYDKTTEAMTLVAKDSYYQLQFTADGYDAGASYKVLLLDEDLYFRGENETVKEYNFTASSTPVLNMKYAGDITYLSTSEFSNLIINGKPAQGFSVALFSIYEDGQAVSDQAISGTFKTTKPLSVGSTVTLYAGVRPDLRTLDTPEDQCGDVAYLEITGYDAATGTYSFKKAEAEDVIFVPDMLPVNTASPYVERNGNILTIAASELDFSGDKYSVIGLDSQTTLDEGDFIAFYTGDFSASNTSEVTYVEVLSYVVTTDGYEITVSEQRDWQYVSSAMDVHASAADVNKISNSNLRASIEKSVEEQAIESGFVEEAGMYLASLAMATDTFTTLNPNVDLTDYKAVLSDGTVLDPDTVRLMADKAKVEVKKPKVKVKLSDKLEEFEDLEGLRLTLSISTKIIIHANKKSDIEIEITGDFVQEMRLDLGMTAKAVWKVWGIFPYIDEYKINANVDLYEYTGIAIRADITTAEADDDDDDDDDDKKDDEKDDKKDGEGDKINAAGSNIAKELKKLLDKFDSDDDDDDDDDEEKVAISTSLTEKYKAMLENDSDWVELYSVTMLEAKTMLPPACPIVAVEFEADFVIKVNANVSVGLDFYYKNAKRYNYAIDVFARKVTNDVINLVEEQYEFDFYVMGALGVRAGIALELKVGLFSTDLDSVGFTCEGGAYAKLWGYFFYKLSYTATKGRSQEYSGALFIEVGAYLEISFEAQAIKGKYSTEATLYENEWPLWSVGQKENILDFEMEQKDMPEVKFKQYIRETILPDDIFSMNYLDLKEGEEDSAVYSDNPEDNHFSITFTNSKFSYDYKTNTVKVSPADGDTKLEGDMKITWISAPLAFTSKAIERTIHLTWDNLRDGYVIVPHTNGGSYVQIINQAYESAITVPAAPVKAGYVFQGWFEDEALTKSYTFPATMGNVDTDIYAKWTEATDTKYKVRHYQQNLDSDEYTLVETFEGTGTTNSTITPATQTYEGFTTPAAQSLIIQADGSAVMNYYYDRTVKFVTFTPGIVDGEDVVYELKYGARVSTPVFAAAGYVFAGWDKNVSETMGAKDVTYTASWTPAEDTKYRVEYYVMDEEGAYRLKETVAGVGTTGAELDLDSLRKDETYETVGVELNSITINALDLIETNGKATIGADGKTVIKVNYGRAQIPVCFTLNNGEENVEENFYIGQRVAFPNVSKTNYVFTGWYTDPECTVAAEEGVTALPDQMFYAGWEEQAVLVVNHYIAKVDGSFPEEPDRVSTYIATHGETYDFEAYIAEDLLVEDGIEFEKAVSALEGAVSVVAQPGQNAFSIYYKRIAYTLTWNFNEGTTEDAYTVSGEYVYGTPIVVPALKKHGHVYDFDVTPPATMPTTDVTITALWTETDQYYVKFLNYDNTLVIPAQLGYAEDAIVPPTENPVRLGYTFIGWDKEVPEFVGEGGNTFTAQYVRDTYAIEYNLSGGTLAEGTVLTREYNVESANIVLPTTIARTGYTFGGWYTDAEFAEETKLTQIATGSTGNMAVYAKWIANTYTVKFVNAEGATGTMEDMTVTYDETVALTAVGFSKDGYHFLGWATTQDAQNATYADGAAIKNLTAAQGGEITLYALFIQGYTLTYANLGDGQMPATAIGSYDATTSVITLDDPAVNKSGYSFVGWYETEKCDGTPITTITPSALVEQNMNKTVYAKWTANQYSITFDPNILNGSASQTQLMTYDVEAQLDAFSGMNYANPGYSFKGWSTSQHSSKKDYEDGATVSNLATGGDITLYAVWEAISYTIGYDNDSITIGASGNQNPGTYTIATEDINLSAPTGIKSGYGFLGWYIKGTDTKVSQIQKGSTGNIALEARWEHAGTFSVELSSVSGSTATYAVRRTLPAGTVAASATQTVYYRTLNGTAIGGTASAVNFKHVGGSNDYVTFTSANGNNSVQTFKVTGESATTKFITNKGNAVMASVLSTTKDLKKTYYVEIYDVTSTQGGLVGTLDASKKLYTRTLGSACKYLNPDTYKVFKEYKNSGWTQNMYITESGWQYSSNYEQDLTVSGLENFLRTGATDICQYVKDTSSYYDYYIKMDAVEIYDGWRYVMIDFYDNRFAKFKFNIGSGDSTIEDWRSYNIPNGGGLYDYNAYATSNVSRYTDGPGYLRVTSAVTKVRLAADAEGSFKDDWKVGTTLQYLRPVDTTAPQQVGIATLAFGKYKAGSTINLAVEFNEVVNLASLTTAQKDSIKTYITNTLKMPAASIGTITGNGTNVMVIPVTLSSNLSNGYFEVTTDTNKKLFEDTGLMKGMVKDLSGN